MLNPPPVHPSRRTYVQSRHDRHVFIFHGLNDHCNKYSYQCLAKELIDHGCCVHGMDMQAHGHSQEFDVQYIGHWTELVDDAVQWVKHVLSGYPEDHTFQFASHSTGGAIALKVREGDGEWARGRAKRAEVRIAERTQVITRTLNLNCISRGVPSTLSRGSRLMTLLPSFAHVPLCSSLTSHCSSRPCYRTRRPSSGSWEKGSAGTMQWHL